MTPMTPLMPMTPPATQAAAFDEAMDEDDPNDAASDDEDVSAPPAAAEDVPAPPAPSEPRIKFNELIIASLVEQPKNKKDLTRDVMHRAQQVVASTSLRRA